MKDLKEHKINMKDFRAELVKIMPGYKWTVHKSAYPNHHMTATGIQTAGFNRLSTLQVEKRISETGEHSYEVKIAGFGKRAPWGYSAINYTLARALRDLQNDCEKEAQRYSGYVHYLQSARRNK